MVYSKRYVEDHIKHLSIDDAPLWGLMSPQHMIEHLIYVFRLSIGEVKQEVVTPKDKLDRYQASLFGERRLPKFFKNPYLRSEEVEDLEFESLSVSKEELLKYCDKYEDFFRNHSSAVTDHVFYGSLDKEKWDLIHFKHLEHHFRQFDLMKKLDNGYVMKWIDKQGIGRIEFYHPAHNSLPARLLNMLCEALQEYGQRSDCQVIILQSGGDRTFCAGASFEELLAINNEVDGKDFFMGFANVINAIRRSSKLVIGRVQGKAVGGGVGIAAATDYCFATKYASLKLSELGIGIGPFVIGPAVERKIGVSAFSALSLDFKNFYDAEWGLSKGLYHQVVDSCEALDEAIDVFSSNLASTNPEARSSLKRVLWKGTNDWDSLLSARASESGKLVLSQFTKDTLSTLKKS